MSSLTPRLDKLDKNYIINGNFDYWQRNTTGTITGAVVAVDRFTSNYNAGAAGTISRSTDIPDFNSLYSAQVDVTTGLNAQIGQRIESVFARELASKDVTFKIKAKAVDSTGRPIRLLVLVPTVTDNWASSTTVTDVQLVASPTTGVWNDCVATVSIPADAIRGLHFIVYRGGASATTSTRYSQMQVAIGSFSDLNFSYAGRNLVNELILCQRYFEKSYNVDIPLASITAAGQITFRQVANHQQPISFKVRKRITATPTFYSPVTGANAVWRDGSAGVDRTAAASSNGETGTNVDITGAVAGNTMLGHWSADAEL